MRYSIVRGSIHQQQNPFSLYLYGDGKPIIYYGAPICYQDNSDGYAEIMRDLKRRIEYDNLPKDTDVLYSE